MIIVLKIVFIVDQYCIDYLLRVALSSKIVLSVVLSRVDYCPIALIIALSIAMSFALNLV